MMMKSKRKLGAVPSLLFGLGWLIIGISSQDTNATKELKEKDQTYYLVDWTLVTPQWLVDDLYEPPPNNSKQLKIRYPHPEQIYGITQVNQELVLLSQKDKELVPTSKRALERQKKARRLLKFQDYEPVRTSGINAKHGNAEKHGLRLKTLGSTDAMILPMLYMPTGWPLFLFLVFSGWVFFVPLLGALLVEVGSRVALIFQYFLWGPVKRLLRMLVIQREKNRQRWIRFLAPPYYLEPRSTWKMPYLLRHSYVEDIPPELAHKPPINKIDYTLYMLNEEDYDDVDLEMDELEFIDEMLQFKEKNPTAVARLLKHRLGVEKFYNYFDEDILSDEEDMDLPLPAPLQKKTEELKKGEEGAKAADAATKDDDFAASKPPEEKKEEEVPEYLAVLEVDEQWMHPEFDETFEGTPFELDEIRKRREIVKEIKEEVKYLHTLIQSGKQYTDNITDLPVERKIQLQRKAKKLMEKYVRYSQKTKERVAELEPSGKAQVAHNIALSKYLPLIGTMSHYNHRLNLRHDKQKDPDKRARQLDVFGGP